MSKYSAYVDKMTALRNQAKTAQSALDNRQPPDVPEDLPEHEGVEPDYEHNRNGREG